MFDYFLLFIGKSYFIYFEYSGEFCWLIKIQEFIRFDLVARLAPTMSTNAVT